MKYLALFFLALCVPSIADAQSYGGGYDKGYRYDRPYRGDKGPVYDRPYRGGKGLREDGIRLRGNEWRWEPRRR